MFYMYQQFIKEQNDWKYTWLFFIPEKILAVGSTESKGLINVAAITRIKRYLNRDKQFLKPLKLSQSLMLV